VHLISKDCGGFAPLGMTDWIFAAASQGRHGLRLGQMGRKGAGPGRLGWGRVAAREVQENEQVERVGRVQTDRSVGKHPAPSC
jgi:hypothetical protein